MPPSRPPWTHEQRRALRYLGAASFLLGLAHAYLCLVEDPSHGPWWPYECAPAALAVVLAAALWREATWAVAMVFVLLALAIFSLLWEAFANEPAALLLLWLPILLLVSLSKAVGRTTWERLKATLLP